MEAPRTALDQETWLTLFMPGSVLVAAVYARFWGRLEGLLTGRPGEVQALILVFLWVSASLALGVINSVAARRLYDFAWPWAWPAKKSKGWQLPFRSTAVVRRRKFAGELLPYTALDPMKYGYSNSLPFHESLAEKARDLAGRQGHGWVEGPEDGRHYYDVVSDLIKAWVTARVGNGVSKEAWEYAARFRQLNDAYVNLAVALPISLIVVASIPSTPAGAWYWPSTVAVAAGLLVACQWQAVTHWIQWQGELCRLFYAAYPGDRAALVRPGDGGQAARVQ
jgi:hypothetical protein